MDLPNDMWINISEYLSFFQRIPMMMTNKRFHDTIPKKRIELRKIFIGGVERFKIMSDVNIILPRCVGIFEHNYLSESKYVSVCHFDFSTFIIKNKIVKECIVHGEVLVKYKHPRFILLITSKNIIFINPEGRYGTFDF